MCILLSFESSILDISHIFFMVMRVLRYHPSASYTHLPLTVQLKFFVKSVFSIFTFNTLQILFTAESFSIFNCDWLKKIFLEQYQNYIKNFRQYTQSYILYTLLLLLTCQCSTFVTINEPIQLYYYELVSMHAVMSNSETPWPVSPQSPQSIGFSRQEYWSGLHFLQGIFPTWG